MSQDGIQPHSLVDSKFAVDVWTKTLFPAKAIPDYTFEERYVRGTPRPVYPERDELDRLHLLRVEGLPIRVDWCVVQAFLESVRANPDKVVYLWCDENGDEEFRHTYRVMYDKTRSIAAHLKNTYNFAKGDRVLLVYEPCVEFFHAFWACLILGVIPAPVCPPDPFNLEGDHTEKLVSIHIDATPKAILTSSKYKDSVAAARLLYPEAYAQEKNAVMDSSKYLWIPTDTLTHIPDEEFEICFDQAVFTHIDPAKRVGSNVGWTPMFNPRSTELFKPKVTERDVAFLQYTSGSTGLAKGVIVHHRTLGSNVFNCALLTQGLSDAQTYQWANGVSWLPTFHDMGLIGFHVTPILIGGTMLYQSPIHFIQNPVSWLKMISRCNKVFTGAPPFALDLLCKRTTDAELNQLHLESIGSLILGAEPIRASYMEMFTKKFTPVGFNPRRYVTCFGMAENILHVTGKWGVGYGVKKILVGSELLRQNKLKVFQNVRIDVDDDSISTTTTTTTTTSKAQNGGSKSLSPSTPSIGSNDDQNGYQEESQWLVSSGEIVPFMTKQTMGKEINDAENLKSRVPHYARREYGSYVICVDPDTKVELPEGQIGEVWILSSSKTAGYWNRPELSQEQFHAVLSQATNESTKELIKWVTTVLPKRFGGADTKGNLDPSITGISVETALNDVYPHSTLLANSLNTTIMDPVTNSLVFTHTTTPIENIKAEWLRTGDMGVIHDGEIYITGRIKDMIILRGQNFYADDIEHSFSTNTDDLTKTNTSTMGNNGTSTTTSTTNSTKPTRSPALSLIRPGHAIAYSIELSPTKHSDPRSDPVIKAGVEGEHLCLLVELSSDVITTVNSDSTSSSAGDDGKLIVRLKNEDGDENGANKKSGNQAPLWQRMLMTYSTQIIGGMSSLNTNDLDIQQRETQQPRSCNEKMYLYGRAMLFSAVRMGMATGSWLTGSTNPLQSIPTTTNHTNGAGDNTNNGPNETNGGSGNNANGNGDDFNECDRFLPPDTETTKMKSIYPQSQLNSIAAAIRRIISSKFMLIVDKITFITPRTIRKTSSGKKRRNDTVFAVENGYLNHRIIGHSYSKSYQTYTNLIQNQAQGGAANVITNQTKSSLSTTNAVKAVVAGTTTTTTLATTTTSSKPFQSIQTQSHYAGTVGISLSGRGDKYETTPTAPLSLISTSTTLMGKGTPDKASYLAHSTAVNNVKAVNGERPGVFKAGKLLPNYSIYQQQFSNQEQIYIEIKSNLEFSNKITFETLKPRILGLVCKEINATHARNEHDDEDSIAPAEQFTFGDSGSSILTVEYLNHVSTLDSEKQNELLDEFGMDSITGFKLSKAFSDEFNLPASNLGPHLFLNDSSLDGVVTVLLNLIKSTAQKRVLDYETRFGTKFGPTFTAGTTPTPSTTTSSLLSSEKPTQIHEEYDHHDKTAAYVFRGSCDNNRIPYILGIGTATPHIGAPQELVVEAMLVPMKMDDKSNERFRKIGSHSGIGTRYSVLDNLGQIFWGKEGVNSGNDEFIDVRQQVYKREAVKLSIQSAADAVRDWLGEKIYLTDAERDADRMKKYMECEQLHKNYEKVAKKTITDEKTRIVRAVDAVPTPTGQNGPKSQPNLNKKGPKSSPDTTLATNDPSPVQAELDLMKKHQDKLKSVRSFAEGDSHLVATTSGDSAEDAKILKLGTEISSKLDRTITHIVAITCTGVIVPGLEFHLMKALGLPESTQRLPITFAGCFGAVSGLRTASALATENPLNRVLVVCTELCTLHMQLSDKIDNLVGSALFADGSGAFIVGCAPTPAETPIFSIDSVHGYAIPNTIQCMAWEQTKSGQVIGLAKEIASEIFGVIGDVIDDMLQFSPDPSHPEHRVAPGDCNLAIHPGGPLIINTIQGGFGLPPVEDGSLIPYSHPVAETWKILHEYGNMSSATLVYVLDRLRNQKDKNNKPTPTLAFGPGLSIECSLLHRLDANPGDKNPKNKK